MANTLTAVTPRLLAQGLLALRENAIMPQLVNRAYEEEAGERGSSIDVPVSSALAANDVAPGPVPPNTQDIGPTSIPLVMDKWKEAPFYLTDKDQLEIMAGVLPMQASEAIKALANAVTLDIMTCYKDFYGFSGTPGTTPLASDTSAATDVRKILNKQLAPNSDRRIVMDPDMEANALNLRAFQDASWSGSPQAIMEGQLNRKLGFDWWMLQQVPTHTAGTATSITLISDSDVGDDSVTLKVGSGTGTLVVGDIITIAGQVQTYVVTAAATLNTTGVAVSIAPDLKVAVDGSGTPVAVTKKASHVVNLAFHRDAIAFASRPLKNVEPGLGSITQSAVDPLSGLTLRLEITREHRRTKWNFDILYGFKTIRRELGVRLAG